MTLTVTHSKTLVNPDSGSDDKVYGSDYVSATSHQVTGGVASDVGLGNVTNDAQTKASVVPNTVPSAGQILVGNAGGTAYAAVAMSGNGSLTSAGAISITGIRSNTTALSSEGDLREDSSTHSVVYHDSQRERGLSVNGFAAYADPPGFNSFGGNFGTALALAANGGTALIPIVVTAHFLADTLILRSTDTATARSAEWSIYQQYLNNGNSGENALTQVSSNLYGTFSFTPVAASTQTSQATTPPVYLAPGVYWLALRNTSAAQSFGLGTTGAGSFAPNVFQTKTLSSALGSTVDAVAATWTKSTAMPGVRLQGRVFGQTTVF